MFQVNVLAIWSALLAASAEFAVAPWFMRSKNRSEPAFSSVERKLFHVAITAAYVVGVGSEPLLLHFSSAVMFCVFVVAEVSHSSW
jgi:hypothetical protein